MKNTAKLALQKAENAKRQRALEEKCRQTECLETVKIMNAAKVRLQVYEQDMDSDEETSILLQQAVAGETCLQSKSFSTTCKVSQTAIKLSLPARG